MFARCGDSVVIWGVGKETRGPANAALTFNKLPCVTPPSWGRCEVALNVRFRAAREEGVGGAVNRANVSVSVSERGRPWGLLF